MKKILSIHPWLISFPVEEQIRVAKEAGFDGLDYIAGISEVLLSQNKIMYLSKKYKMPVLGVHSPLPLIVATPSIFFQKLFKYISLIPECRVYNFHLSGFMHPFLNWGGNTIKRFMELAEEKKVDVSFESNPVRPVHGFSWFYPKATYRPEAFAEYCVRNNLPITFDTSHIADQGYDIVEFYKKYHKSIKLIHLSDYKNGKQHLSLGDGNLPLKELFQEMKKTRYREVVSFEVYRFLKGGSTKDKLTEIKKDLEYFNKFAT